mmetsp:Transcript_4382/g.11987  ORF Transcript_4382/g.11987 Transcript_4382/m.11987 type:complete len:217 (-) Transcript_4382:725-1375(-)|eukprot:CAMPEP_0185839580 /NCGR_PEP_ID=MMETSP1353-20130828/14806_1 /TAXON_ID=1077150 /ORGANISM="Erythrolobus australicus, Strain CCMP3124" /LENGTH=216 /DNA_ID=CAMNT_0028538773 /DNA_START=1166 /DNA_END=1816 /DNA_ORIENTATION=-
MGLRMNLFGYRLSEAEHVQLEQLTAVVTADMDAFPPQPWRVWPSESGSAGYLLGDAAFSQCTSTEQASALRSKYGITHVLNCAAEDVRSDPAAFASAGISYLAIAAQDLPTYPLLKNTAGKQALEFLRSAHGSTTNAVLVHCVQGVNRSATLLAAHLVACSGSEPMHVVRQLRNGRGPVLTNKGFRIQLVQYCTNLHNPSSAALDATESATSSVLV